MGSRPSRLSPERGYLAAVIAGGLANSLHPCGIAVLLVLVSFLYALRRSRLSIMTMGLLYVLRIFATYFFIGLGLVKTISLSSRPFFFARAAALAAILLGLVSLKDYFFPGSPLRLKIPDFTKGGIQKFIEKASLPSALGLGILVGICAFPCTGGIYTVIITTLATTKTVSFYSYLLLYNFLFVLPLLIIVVLSGNRRLIERVERFERRSSRRLHLVTGSLMILLGSAIYLWLRMLS
jgi:cytochrome c biogenesis protein CcdA